MNRKEALKCLLDGHKVVSYFGYEYELSKHGIQSGDSYLPMPEGNEYTIVMGENPNPVGSFAWAEWEFDRGREVISPSGYRFAQSYTGEWDKVYVPVKDFTEPRWEVVPTTEEE